MLNLQKIIFRETTTILYNALELEDFKNNTKNRCYSCKKNFMTKIKEEANRQGYVYVLGSVKLPTPVKRL